MTYTCGYLYADETLFKAPEGTVWLLGDDVMAYRAIEGHIQDAVRQL